jgi:hypothetical protein
VGFQFLKFVLKTLEDLPTARHECGFPDVRAAKLEWSKTQQDGMAQGSASRKRARRVLVSSIQRREYLSYEVFVRSIGIERIPILMDNVLYRSFEYVKFIFDLHKTPMGRPTSEGQTKLAQLCPTPSTPLGPQPLNAAKEATNQSDVTCNASNYRRCKRLQLRHGLHLEDHDEVLGCSQCMRTLSRGPHMEVSFLH